LNYRMRFIPSFSLARVRAEDAFAIAADMDVVMVEWDLIAHASVATSVRALKAEPSSVYSPNTAWEAGYKGRGINIGILDTGVDDGHPSLDDMDDDPSTNDPKFVAGFDATARPRVATNPDDDYKYYKNGYWHEIFHGTHVAGIALGTGGSTDSAGVAPEAKLIDVKVLDSNGRGPASDIIAGIEWCIANKNTAWPGQQPENYGIDVLNMSLGFGYSSDGQDAVSRVVNKAVAAGLVVVCAVGNDNLTNMIASPAAADGAIAVGSVNDMGTITRTDDIISSHSNWGSNRGPRLSDGDSDQMDELKPDVTAYGSGIISAKGIDPGQNGTEWHELSGTSMATPHVAGVCALILQAHSQFLPHDVKNVLRVSAEDKNGTYNSSLSTKYDVDYGWGIVDAYEAVTTTNVPPDLWISRKPVWWSSKDIWLTNPPFVGQANTIYARIHNTSGTAANGVTVTFKAGIFGIGQPNWLWQQTTTISVAGTGTVVASVPWTPTAALLQKGPGHTCIRVEISYAQDPNTQNNIAQKNLDVMQSTSSSMFTFRAWNPFDAHKEAFFGMNRENLPEGWGAYFEPDTFFTFNYADSADIFGEIFPGPYASVSDTGVIQIAEFFKGSIAPVGGVTISLAVQAAPAKIVLPDTFAAYLDTILIPITVTTDSMIGVAQFVIDYDSTVVEFLGADIGSDIAGFTHEVQTELPFPPSSMPETNNNFLVQLNGGGTNFFSGQNQQVALLSFVVIDSTIDHGTPLILDTENGRSFLTTSHLHDIFGDEMSIFPGGIIVRQYKWPLTLRDILDLIDPARPVSGVKVTILVNDQTFVDTTDSEGFVYFSEIPAGDLVISQTKEGDLRSAITGTDALLTLRYLAFMESLDDGQMIAADVNRDSRVTGSDALAILRYLAFFSSDIASTGRWDFIAATPLPIPYPFQAPTQLDYHSYLFGDANLSWGLRLNSPALLKNANGELPQINIGGNMPDIRNNEIVVPIAIQPMKSEANTIIFTLNFDPSYFVYQATQTTDLADGFMIAANGEEKGKVHIAMAGVSGINNQGEFLKISFTTLDKKSGSETKMWLSDIAINDLKIENPVPFQINLAEKGTAAPNTFVLAQNYPNPFNSETTIRYGIPNSVDKKIQVTLNIYNTSGQLVRTLVDEKKAAGYYSARWNGRDNWEKPVATGIYLFRLQVGKFNATKKILMLK
ncbi:MAG: S8 family serine peptidase, partial [Calditrichaeota bacterium]|nr:S8 family serine peptidase [Calditrichota bacterium]